VSRGSELSSNIIKYGKYGYLELSMVFDGLAKGVSLVARDFGPPFRDLETALRDGCDEQGPIDPAAILKRGGIGAGLGAVIRLTNSFSVEPEVDGKRIVAIRYLGRPVPRWPAIGRREGV
jgi:serine/threonine-protein kinase RsbT